MALPQPNKTCDRCHKKTSTWIMSMFNRDMLCPECKDRERQHPDYEKACDADQAAVADGNYNFPGIGKPDDL